MVARVVYAATADVAVKPNGNIVKRLKNVASLMASVPLVGVAKFIVRPDTTLFCKSVFGEELRFNADGEHLSSIKS